MLRTKPIRTTTFVFFLSVYFFLVFNVPLIKQLVEILEHIEGLKLGMILSLPVFFIASFYILFSITAIKYVIKPATIILVLTSSIVSYAMYYYGTVFDTDMIQNFAETNVDEALSYLNKSVVVWLLVTGVIPSLIIGATTLRWHKPTKELSRRAGSMAAAAMVIVAIAALYYKDYASLGRNNHYLKKMIIPTQYVYSTAKFVNQHYLSQPKPHRILGTDAEIADKKKSRKPRLLVIVLGETARSMNFHLNGYSRPTNEFTEKKGVISFKHVSSCGTATAVSVPCMFSALNHDDYDWDRANNQDNLLDILQRSGVQVRWLENDGGCKGVCERIDTTFFKSGMEFPECQYEYCRDGVLLSRLDAELSSFKKEDSVLVLHLVGSHGPTYYQRYPEEFQRFTPDCPRSDIQNCTDLQIVNSYDNTIYYDDFVISEVISKIEQQQFWDSSLLYVSDHGESLGEKGLYLHGMPYAFAPREQTQVPMLLWMSNGFRRQSEYSWKCISDQADNADYSHDNLFDSVLGIMQVNTEIYRPDQDIFAGCQQTTVASRSPGSEQTAPPQQINPDDSNTHS